MECLYILYTSIAASHGGLNFTLMIVIFRRWFTELLNSFALNYTSSPGLHLLHILILYLTLLWKEVTRTERVELLQDKTRWRTSSNDFEFVVYNRFIEDKCDIKSRILAPGNLINSSLPWCVDLLVSSHGSSIFDIIGSWFSIWMMLTLMLILQWNGCYICTAVMTETRNQM